MNIEYYAEDGRIKSLGDNELTHFKYLKKIKVGSGYRYFYSQDEVNAYYKSQKPIDSEYQKELMYNSKKNNWNNNRKDKIVKDKVVKDKIVKDKVVKDDIVKDKIVKDKVVKDDIVKDKVSSEYEREIKYNSKKNNWPKGKTNQDIIREQEAKKRRRKEKIKNIVNSPINKASKSIRNGRKRVEKLFY